jgi:hypothetical protein
MKHRMRIRRWSPDRQDACAIFPFHGPTNHPGLSNGAPNPFSFHYSKWYAGLALFRDQGVARLEGILP